MSKLVILSALGASLSLSACNAAGPSFLEAPANPYVGTTSPRYSSVTAGVKSYEVTDPKDWIEQNRQVAPADRTEDRGNDAAAAARRGR